MTDELNTQTVAETTEAPAQQVAEVNGAQETAADLDSILAEFDQSTRKTAPQTVPEQKPAALSPDVANRIEQLERRVAEKETKEALEPVITSIRGDIPKDVLSNEEVLDLIDGRARRDPRLQQAWIDRASNPAAWNKIQKALGQEMAKKFSKLPDPNATEDREAVTAAVRGASSRAPEGRPPNFGDMSDNEFRLKRKELYGF